MIAIPYGKSHLDVAFPYNGLLTSRVDELKSDRTGRELVEEAMASPIGTPGLAALEAEAAEQTERIRVRITDQVEFEG